MYIHTFSYVSGTTATTTTLRSHFGSSFTLPTVKLETEPRQNIASLQASVTEHRYLCCVWRHDLSPIRSIAVESPLSRCGASSRLTWALETVLVFEDKLIVTDLMMVLDATLFAVFALFAALFFPPAALLVAARDRGLYPSWAQPGRLAAAASWVPLGRQQPLSWLLPRLLSVTWVDACCDAPRFPPMGLIAGRDELCCV